MTTDATASSEAAAPEFPPGFHALGEPERMSYPGGKDGMFRVRCSCREYITSPSSSPERALRDATAHRGAKRANRQAVLRDEINAAALVLGWPAHSYVDDLPVASHARGEVDGVAVLAMVSASVDDRGWAWTRTEHSGNPLAVGHGLTAYAAMQAALQTGPTPLEN